MNNADFYDACNLRSNPFRSNATFEDDPRMSVWAGQEQERSLLEKFLGRSRADQVGNSNLILLHGDWGTGKSHALLWGVQWLRGLTEGGRSSAYYIPTLKKEKGKTTFAGAFVEDLIKKTTLIEEVAEFRQFLKTQVSKLREEQSLGPKIPDEDVIEHLIPATQLHAFAKEIDRREGEEEIRELLAPKGITDYQAMVTFSKIVNLFVYEVRFKNETRRFRQSVHLMIDELDILRQAPTKEILEVNDLIRHLYDACPNCFGLVLAVSAEQELLSSMFAEYILTRISRQIEFKPFDRAASADFAVHVMDATRADSADEARKGTFPFTDEALDAILGQLTFRTPRKVVTVMQQVIEEARLADLDPRKGRISVSDIDRTGLLDEVL